MVKLAVFVLLISFHSIFTTKCDPDDVECHEKQKYTRGIQKTNFIQYFHPKIFKNKMKMN